MLDEIDGQELREWWRLEAIEPWSDRRGDVQTAQIVWALAELHRDRKKHPAAHRVADFLLEFGAGPNAEDEDEKADRLATVAALLTTSAGALWTGDQAAVPDWALTPEERAARARPTGPIVLTDEQ